MSHETAMNKLQELVEGVTGAAQPSLYGELFQYREDGALDQVYPTRSFFFDSGNKWIGADGYLNGICDYFTPVVLNVFYRAFPAAPQRLKNIIWADYELIQKALHTASNYEPTTSKLCALLPSGNGLLEAEIIPIYDENDVESGSWLHISMLVKHK